MTFWTYGKTGQQKILSGNLIVLTATLMTGGILTLALACGKCSKEYSIDPFYIESYKNTLWGI